jgi:hypothetical protein
MTEPTIHTLEGLLDEAAPECLMGPRTRALHDSRR